MGDKFTNGMLSGLLGGLLAVTLNFILIDLFHFGSLRFGGFAGVLLLGKLPDTFLEYAISYVGCFSYTSTLGILFAYLTPLIQKKYYWLKAISFGLFVWFASYAIVLLFKAPHLTRASAESAITNALASMLFGLVNGYVLHRLTEHPFVQE